MKKRILIGFGLLLLLFLLGNLVAVIYIAKTTDRMNQLIVLHQIEILRENLIVHIHQVQSNLFHKKIRRGGDVDKLVSHVREMDKVMEQCLGCHHSPEVSQGLLGMHDMASDYKTTISRLVTASAATTKWALLELRAQELGQELIAMAQGMSFTANARLQQKTQETMATIKTVRGVLYGTLLLGFLVAVATASLLIKSFDRRLQKLLEATRRISQGELQHRVEISDGEGSEFRELGDAFNVMSENLQQSQRQTVQNAKFAAIGELATNVVYEVNNPLAGVLEYTGLLLTSEEIPAEKKELLKTIERETLRAREILKNVLNFSCRKPPLLERTEIRTLVQESLNIVSGHARTSNVAVHVECPSGLQSVVVDGNEMKQVFVNLMQNALSAMPTGGILTIRCKQVNNKAGKKAVAIEVVDSGVGIPDDHLDKIFDPFFTTRTDSDGLGIGLSISYMIVKNHGGSIEVDSKYGNGSTFRVLLPLSE